MQTASNILGRLLGGSMLTRRERKQLLRTTTDLFQLVRARARARVARARPAPPPAPARPLAAAAVRARPFSRIGRSPRFGVGF